MNERLSDIYTWSRRYLSLTSVAIICALVYVLFFCDNSISDTYTYTKEIDRKQAEITANMDTIRYYESLLKKLSTDPETMERIVREQYHMQRPNEDIYIVE